MRRGRRVSLPPYLLQCLADLVCGQRRQVGVRHCNRRLAALLESHRRGRDLDLEPTIASPDLKRLARPQSQSLSQRLGNDDPPCSVDGDSHATHNAMEMTFNRRRSCRRRKRASRTPPPRPLRRRSRAESTPSILTSSRSPASLSTNQPLLLESGAPEKRRPRRLLSGRAPAPPNRKRRGPGNRPGPLRWRPSRGKPPCHCLSPTGRDAPPRRRSAPCSRRTRCSACPRGRSVG